MIFMYNYFMWTLTITHFKNGIKSPASEYNEEPEHESCFISNIPSFKHFIILTYLQRLGGRWCKNKVCRWGRTYNFTLIF